MALDAARAHIAELEAAQPDQKSLFGFDLKNDKPDNIAEAIIGNVDLGKRRGRPRRLGRPLRSERSTLIVGENGMQGPTSVAARN